MRNFVLVLALGLSTFAVGCAAEQHGAATAVVPAGMKAPGTATVGDKTICPVSGEDFVVTADSPKVEIDGKTYYTCCPGCAKKLKADPKKYLDKFAKPSST
jgi:YHS domain-containing protein